MSTARQHCEPGVDDKGPHWLSDPFWSRLNTVAGMKLVPQSRREAKLPDPASKPSARRMDFDAAWQRYCDVIRELEMTAAELDALRNCNE